MPFCIIPLYIVLKFSSNQLSPTHYVVFNAKFKSSFERKPKQIPPLSICVSCDLKDVGFQKRNVVSSNKALYNVVYHMPSIPIFPIFLRVSIIFLYFDEIPIFSYIIFTPKKCRDARMSRHSS